MPPKLPTRRALKIDQSSLGERGVASAALPSFNIGNSGNRAKFTTYFTKVPQVGADPFVIYSGDRLWADVTLMLETAGPVAVGDMSSITPVLSGKGTLLPTGIPMTFRIAKGNKLYVAATAVNRIKLLVQPVPWLEQIAGLMFRIAGIK